MGPWTQDPKFPPTPPAAPHFPRASIPRADRASPLFYSMADNASQLGGAGSHGVAQGRASPITVRFSVHYATRPGENLVACGDSQLMGQWVVSNGVRRACVPGPESSPAREARHRRPRPPLLLPLPVSYTDGGWWEGEVTFPSSARPSTVHYKYVLEASGDAHWEFGPDRKLDLGDAGGTASTVLLVADVWQVRPQQLRGPPPRGCALALTPHARGSPRTP